MDGVADVEIAVNTVSSVVDGSLRVVRNDKLPSVLNTDVAGNELVDAIVKVAELSVLIVVEVVLLAVEPVDRLDEIKRDCAPVPE